MTEQKLRKLLMDVKEGNLDINEALREMKFLPYEDLGFAKVDHHRALRQGTPEVIFCQGKTVTQVVQIADKILLAGQNLLATRASFEMYNAVRQKHPDAKYHDTARIITSEVSPVKIKKGFVSILCAGTSDIPVAEEAAVTAEALGNEVRRVFDVGVAGIHRLLEQREVLADSRVLVAVAGMEGALPSVVAGLVDCPVIAVPTSIGYGASFGGISALLSMLNSCASGVSVVNIDNGFGAGYIANLINYEKGK
jgi:NCAIR mutase (PurE)-related protein